MWIKLFFFVAGLIIQQQMPNVDIMEHGGLGREGAINLHLMMASHMDAGWIYTFEQYYQGTNSQAGGCVKCLLNNIMSTLPKNPDRKYDMSEVSFLKRWWRDLDAQKRDQLAKLVKNKQFGFMNGGWVANDEATAYYEGIMDNFILGHRWLKDNLNVDTFVGWQVDSFGNSATQASLMAQAGYEGLFFSRADYVDREKRRAEQSLQFNWAPPNPHDESMFTQMMYVTYSDNKFMVPDNYYCRSIFCHGRLQNGDYQKVVNYVKNQYSSFKTKNILFLVCDDFLFTGGAESEYDAAEAMIKYFNTRPELGIYAKFSHLSDYLDQVKADFKSLGSDANIPYKHDDFFPFIEKSGHVWTGYFTSKSMFKLMVRQYSEYYNAVKLLLSKILLMNNNNILQNKESDHQNINQALNTLEEPLAIVQHHDAVSGTMKEYVRTDYENMLIGARRELESTLRPIMVNYLKEQIKETLVPSTAQYDWFYQDDTYEIIFDPGHTPTFVVFNPGNARRLVVKVKVPAPSYSIIDESNNEVPVDLICHSQDSKSDCYIYFAENFAPYSTKVYKVSKSDNAKKVEPLPINNEALEIKLPNNLVLKLNKDLVTFDYKYCVTETSCTEDTFTLDYEYYQGIPPSGSTAPSGAYVLTPNPQNKFKYSTISSANLYRGKHLAIIQIFRNNVRTDLKIVLNQPERGIQIDSYLDPVNDEGKGKEIVLIIRSNSIKNGNTIFYTDANGYYMQKRVKNHKDDYTIASSEGVGMNYYPMTSNVYIEDSDSGQRMSLVTDRAQGVTSLNPGEIEVMIHRVTVKDDWKGVGEPLRERDPMGGYIRVRTRHYLMYSQPKHNVSDQRRQQQYDLDRPVQLWFYVSNDQKFAEASIKEAQKPVVPDLVKLYIRSYQPNEYIVRLHNMDEINSKQVRIYDLNTKNFDLLNEFAGKDGLKLKSINELSWITTTKKSYEPNNALDPKEPSITHNDESDFSSVSLVPMEIRTFSILLENE